MLNQTIEIINSNRDLITVISNIILTLTTIALASLTAILARESRLSRKLSSSPVVVAYAIPNERIISAIDLVIANVGTGAAIDVNIEFLADFKEFSDRGLTIIPKERTPLLSALPQGEKIQTFFNTYYELHDKIGEANDFIIRMHYNDIKGKSHTRDSIISTKTFKWIATIGEDPIEKIATSLREIEREFKHNMRKK